MRHSIAKAVFAAATLMLACFSAFAGSAKITKVEFGEKWPFTVSEGVLTCTPYGQLHLITFSANGKVYGLNGTARNLAKERGFAEIDEIWKNDPQVEGLKINIDPILQKAFTLCD